jgi:hypothetical protein
MVSMVWEDGAYGPIVTDYRSRPTAKFVVGAVPILDRVSEVQTSSVSDLYNGFIIRYNYDPLLDAYSGFVTRDRTNSDVCAYSETLVGRRDFEVLESPYIIDETTANFIADWLVAHYAIPSYLVEYEALPVAFFNRMCTLFTTATTTSPFTTARYTCQAPASAYVDVAMGDPTSGGNVNSTTTTWQMVATAPSGATTLASIKIYDDAGTPLLCDEQTGFTDAWVAGNDITDTATLTWETV